MCIVKFIIGTVSGSVSITADAFNNLSDAGSNVVTIAGAKLANKPVDKEHPFGHGRLGLGGVDRLTFTASGQRQHHNCHRYFTHCPAPLRIKEATLPFTVYSGRHKRWLKQCESCIATCMIPPWELMSPLCVLERGSHREALRSKLHTSDTYPV